MFNRFKNSFEKKAVWIGTAIIATICVGMELFLMTDPKVDVSSLLSDEHKVTPAERIAQRNQPDQLFIRHCASCHGDKGEGNRGYARVAGVAVPNLQKGPFRYERDLKSIQALIENGGGLMPGFGKQLTKEQSEKLAQYVLILQEKTEGQ